jgi:potassium-transporting ATPase KdpC subunit
MKDFRIGLKIFLLLSVVTGIAYPSLITAYSFLVVSPQAYGSLIEQNQKIKGSELLSQNFTRAEYFWSRPSAIEHNPSSSGASNQGPTSETLKKQIADRIKSLKQMHPENQDDIPQDLLFASGSGLDPHISPEAAFFQASRVAKARNLDLAILRSKISEMTENRQFGILGEPRVNVLKLNLALDRMK